MDSDEQAEDSDAEEDLSGVTCGSVIKMRHVSSNHRLHSHQVTYGSGSGQQSVTGLNAVDDPNSYWIVRAPFQKRCVSGKPLRNGDTFRLQHLNTRRNLHSHLHQSPLTHQQEVSAYGEDGNGDTGDNWKLVTDGTDVWKRGAVVKLQHVDTGRYLSSNKNKFGNPIPGQQEVCAIQQNNKDTEWSAEEGFYFPARK